MPIYAPGEKFRHSRVLKKSAKRRQVVALLSLTAMVDMFTVLVIFLLQNFNPSTNAVLYIPKEVTLPKAEQTKDLKPAVVVTISPKEVSVDKKQVILLGAVKAQQDWSIAPLLRETGLAIRTAKAEYDRNLQVTLQKAADSVNQAETPWNKVTIQADRSLDFLTVKKVMYTVIQAGAGEINFAVTKEASR